MLKVSFQQGKNDPMAEIEKDIKELDQSLKDQINVLGQESLAYMRETISSGKHRPSGPTNVLEEAIDIEYHENGWGIGDILKLNVIAPFWAAINFGSSHMVGKHLPRGEFRPGNPKPDEANFREGRWYPDGKGSSPIVTRPIEPKNYISKTAFWLSNRFDAIRGRQ